MSIVVSGGNVSTDGDYTVRTFTSSGTLTISGGTLTDVQYLLVAGGSRAGVPVGTYVAGGGAGGVLTGNITIASGTYPITIGAVSNNSSFLNMVANGGGYGSNWGNGQVGGSGGQGGVGIASNITGTLTYYAAGGTGRGPNGIGNNSPGYNNYGAGGGYVNANGTLLPPQPGVLIIRYPTV